MDLDDILYHVAITVLIVGMSLLTLPPWAWALLVGLGFLAREAQQLAPHPAWCRPWRWSAQKSAEWIAPLAAGLALALAFGRSGG